MKKEENKVIVFSGVSPHPPILVPEIGKKKIEKCMKSRRGLQTFSQRLKEAKPEILVLITPHGPVFYDAVTLYASEAYSGNFRDFGAKEISVTACGFPLLAQRIHKEAQSQGIPVLTVHEKNYRQHGIPSGLDHATMVPLYYFKEAGLDIPMVLISMGLLPYQELFKFGKCIRRALLEEGKPAAVVASGDLSHRLIPAAPAGYDPTGKVFDEKMVGFLRDQNAQGVLALDPDLISRAGECGFRPIVILLGVLDETKPKGEVISYEGPFGVGYAVVSYQ